MTFKPKSKSKHSYKAPSSWFSKISRACGISKVGSLRRPQARTVAVVSGLLFLFYVLGNLFTLGRVTRRNYPAEHGNYINEIPASSPLIYPTVEHTQVLKEIGVRGLFTVRTDIEGRSSYVLNAEDKPLTDEDKKKTADQVLLAKKSFLDHGKLVYHKAGGSPEIVVVTLLDFETFDQDTIVSIVQNRVDYAQRHKYGVYIRWFQEFMPLLENQDLQASQEYIKPFIMRAAIHAFPQAKYIFFVDQYSLIMNLELKLQQHLLDPAVLDMALLKNMPVIPNSNIKTYTHFNVETTRIIIPQSPSGHLDLSSIVVSTDLYGKAFLEYLIDPLFRNYNWESFSGSVAHFLQWHPQFLGKTALVVQKLIAAPLDVTKTHEEAAADDAPDAVNYSPGDFVISLRNCKLKSSCAEDIAFYYSSIQNN